MSRIFSFGIKLFTGVLGLNFIVDFTIDIVTSFVKSIYHLFIINLSDELDFKYLRDIKGKLILNRLKIKHVLNSMIFKYMKIKRSIITFIMMLFCIGIFSIIIFTHKSRNIIADFLLLFIVGFLMYLIISCERTYKNKINGLEYDSKARIKKVERLLGLIICCINNPILRETVDYEFIRKCLNSINQEKISLKCLDIRNPVLSERI